MQICVSFVTKHNQEKWHVFSLAATVMTSVWFPCVTRVNLSIALVHFALTVHTPSVKIASCGNFFFGHQRVISDQGQYHLFNVECRNSGDGSIGEFYMLVLWLQFHCLEDPFYLTQKNCVKGGVGCQRLNCQLTDHC